jgi:uncharacterized membrane protein YhhN
MKKFNALSLLFVFAVIADLIMVAGNNHTARFITKPLLMPLLLVAYYAQARPHNFYSRMICVALLLSWSGDILLMGDPYASVFFILGLVAFLMAHIAYIAYFLNTLSNKRSYFRQRPIMLLPVAAIVIELLNVLWPSLGVMKLPVIVYALVIGTMCAAALWQYKKLNNQASLWFIAGAVSFIISDSLLAINKFSHRIDDAGIYIMVTYCFAQYALAKGSLFHLQSAPAAVHTYAA